MVFHVGLETLRRRVSLPASVAVVIGLVDVARSVILQNVHLELFRREKLFRTMYAGVISGVVVRSLDVGGELVFQVELLATEAP